MEKYLAKEFEFNALPHRFGACRGGHGYLCGRPAAGACGTPLIAAARAGQPALIRSLIAAAADPTGRGGVKGWPAIMHAAHKNQRSRDRSTALIVAAGY